MGVGTQGGHGAGGVRAEDWKGRDRFLLFLGISGSVMRQSEVRLKAVPPPPPPPYPNFTPENFFLFYWVI